MNKTEVTLTRALKIKLLRAIQAGEINLIEFPELQVAQREVIQAKVAGYSAEEKRVLLKLARSRPPEYYAIREEVNIPMKEGTKQRLLKAMQTGFIDMRDFPELRTTAGQDTTVDLDLFTLEEQQILANLSFITTQKSIANP